jgi:uncharacterized protein
MSFTDGLIIVLGLTLFEVISSVDNAVVNADVLATMSPRGRRWFLVYGIIAAVFIVRGLLPLLVVYLSDPSLGIVNAFTATFSSDPRIRDAIEGQKPILLAGGGLYLLYLFFYWLFVEPKNCAFTFEAHIHEKLSFWFYAVSSVVLLAVVWMGMKIGPMVAFGAVVGSTAFFITNGFKHNAEQAEKALLGQSAMSDISKIVYLELLDATFSIDGVLGAFAFTVSVPLILLGNGLGAYVVRWFTIRGVATVKKYCFLKNGAMYSIGFLGLMMVSESLGLNLPTWLPTALTFAVVGLFFWLSVRELRQGRQAAA